MEIWKSQKRRFPDSHRRDTTAGSLSRENKQQSRAKCASVPGPKVLPMCRAVQWNKIVRAPAASDTPLTQTLMSRGLRAGQPFCLTAMPSGTLRKCFRGCVSKCRRQDTAGPAGSDRERPRHGGLASRLQPSGGTARGETAFPIRFRTTTRALAPLRSSPWKVREGLPHPVSRPGCRSPNASVSPEKIPTNPATHPCSRPGASSADRGPAYARAALSA